MSRKAAKAKPRAGMIPDRWIADPKGSPVAILRAVEGKLVRLPIWITIGNTSFHITHENYNGFWYGVMFATDDAWRKS